MPTPPRDVIIIGAGIVGCAIAHELARRGASVRVVDERAPGMGATQASAGMLAPYHEAGTQATFLELGVRSLELYDRFVARVSEDGGGAVEYHRSGTLEVATDDEQLTSLRNAAARLDAQGVPYELLDAQAVRAEEPYLTGGALGGLLTPVHGFVSPYELTRVAAAAARKHGAEIIEGVRARRIASDAGDLVVDTSRGPLKAGAVVLAAGSWAPRIEIEGVTATLPVRPIRGQLLHLAWPGPRLRRVVWGPRCYVVPWDDGTLLVGATAEDAGFDERTTAAGVRDLLDAVCELLPQAWKAGFVEARVGLRPASGDALPIIGASSRLPNLMYAAGHFRNGILLAPLTARLVADAMMDGRIDPAMAALSPRRFGEL